MATRTTQASFYSSSSSSSDDSDAGQTSPNPDTASKTPKDYKQMFQGRASLTKFVDPCEDARLASMKCLDKNNYDRDACTEFFRSYRECKKKWLDQRREDRRNGMSV